MTAQISNVTTTASVKAPYTANPTRISSTHYQMPSQTTENKSHDMKLVKGADGRMHWTCFCEDAVMGKNPECKHRRRFVAWMDNEKQRRAEQVEETLERIGSLESANYHIEKDLNEHSYQLDARAEQEQKLRQTIVKQQEQIDYQRELIGALQSQVCKLNERTIAQDITIQSLLTSHEELGSMVTQMHLQMQLLIRESKEAQARNEQVVRVVIEQPASSRSKREARAEDEEPKAMQVKEDRDEQGKLTSCQVGKFKVRVFGNSAGECECSQGLMGKQCPHVVVVDKHIAAIGK